MSKSALAHLALFLVNAIYAASHILAKGVMPVYLSPSVFIFLRASGAALLFWLIRAFLPREPIARKDWFRIALCGLFGVAVNQLCFFHGLNLSSSINSGIIMTTNPIMVFILSFFFLGEGINLMKACGLLLGASGAVLLTLQGNPGGGSSVQGDLLLFANAMSYAVYLVLAKPLMNRYSPLTVISWVFTFGTFFVLLFPPVIPGLMQLDPATLPGDIVWKILYVIIGVTFLTYLLTLFGLKHLSATISSAYMYFQPPLVFVFAWLFLYLGISEDYTRSLTPDKFLYMGLIVAGVRMISPRRRKKRVV